MSQTRRLLAAIERVQDYLDGIPDSMARVQPDIDALTLLVEAAGAHAKTMALQKLDALPTDTVLVFPRCPDPDELGITQRQEVYTKGFEGFWLWAGSAEGVASPDLPWRRPFVVMFDPRKDATG